MKYFTDPTYLRTIYDGLYSGAIHKDNSSALPMGLVGLYENAFPPASNVNERNKFFEFFAVWSLLKKEVSADFVVPLLEGWTEEQVTGYIAKYSKWFNSPASGKYVLYHERLRTYVLQKISQKHFGNCNEDIIWQCQIALQEKNGNEWERYALEYLSFHILITAIENGDDSALKSLAYNTTHWNRQIKISKGFDWSKRMLNDMMLWAAKYDDEEVIECALNKVDLNHLEQNDAPRILELVAQNDIETALQRIESFGGNDKEGLERKFILYMLCLLELTLLNSKYKPFREEAINKLLKHLDDNIPVDYSILNWNDFFSSYLVFLMACEWEKIGLEYYVISKRTKNWDLESHRLGNSKPDSRFEALSDESKQAISNELERQDYFADKVLDIERVKKIIVDYPDTIEKFSSLSFISHLLYQNGAKEKAQELLLNSIVLADKISTKWEKYIIYAHLSNELIQHGKVTEAIDLVLKSYQGALQIKDEWQKGSVILEISPLLAKLGRVSEALKCADLISPDLFGKSIIISKIIEELAIMNNIYESGKLLLESLETKKGIVGEWSIYRAITSISFEFIKKGKINESLSCLKGLDSDYMVATALKEMALLMNNLGMNDNSRQVMQEALKSANIISERNAKNLAFAEISEAMAIVGSFEDSLRLTEEISIKRNKDFALVKISLELAKVGKIDDALICVSEISSSYSASNAMKSISLVLAAQGRNILAIEIANRIKDDSQRYKTLILVSTIIFRQGKESDSENLMSDIFPLCRKLPDLQEKITSILTISCEFAKQMKIVESDDAMQEAIDYSLDIIDEEESDHVLKQICFELIKQRKYEQALIYYDKISDDSEKENTKIMICIELASNGNIDASEKISQQIFQKADREKCWKSIAEKEYKANGYFNAISLCNKFLNDEARIQIRNNIIKLLDASTISPEIVLHIIKSPSQHISNLEYLLQLSIINKLFFEEMNQEKLLRYNKTLNIQWAIDIATKFEKEFERASHNVQEWINEIKDENDREDVLGWAEKVEQGKMTEDKFLERINKL
jgi:hypothetical protein